VFGIFGLRKGSSKKDLCSVRDACRGAKLVSLGARQGVHPKGSAFAGVIESRGLPTHNFVSKKDTVTFF